MEKTQWFRVGNPNPLPERPGEYEVRFTWPGAPSMRVHWDGKKWGRVGKMKPNHSWGDMWRGLTEQPK